MFGTFPGYTFGSHFSGGAAHIRNGTQPCIHSDIPRAVRIQWFRAQAVTAVTVWHHQLGWQCPSGVLHWSQRYRSTELILWCCCVTQGPRQAAQQQWQPSEWELKSRYKLLTGPWGAIMRKSPRACSKEPTSCSSLLKTQVRALLRDNNSL